MLNLSELSNLVWNESKFPGNLKMDWANMCNEKGQGFEPSQFPWLTLDILLAKSAKYEALLKSIDGFKFSWVPNMRYYLEAWIKETDNAIDKLVKLNQN